MTFFPFSSRQKRLAESRPRLGSEKFVALMVTEGVRKEIAQYIWAWLEDWGYVSEYTPYPDDDLGKLHGIAEEELEIDLILEGLKAFHAPIPDQYTISTFGAVDTPLRVGKLIELCLSKNPR